MTHRNGTRDRLVATTAGDLNIKILKTRTGSFFPTLLHPRSRIDRVLHAVVMEAYVLDVSTHKVDDLVKAHGVESGISKSEVSRICADLDAEVEAFRSPPARSGHALRVLGRDVLEGPHPRPGSCRRLWSSRPVAPLTGMEKH